MDAGLQGARPARASTAPKGYLYSWMAVAACGMVYVGLAATRPDIIATVLPVADQANEQVYGRAASEMADELAVMRKWVHDMQHDLAAARSALHEQATTNAQLMQRIQATEERLAGPAVRDTKGEAARAAVQRTKAQLTPSGVAPAGQQQSATAAPASAAAPIQTAALPEGVRVLNSGPAAPPVPSTPITTGSVPGAPAAVAAPSQTVAPKQAVQGGTRGIEIANADSIDALRSRWGDIAGRNADVVGELAPRYRLATDGRSAPFTLVAGPFGSTADAAKTCAQLKAKGVVCRVSDFSGTAF